MLASVLHTVIIYAVVIFAMRLMGKRQLGELQPSGAGTTSVFPSPFRWGGMRWTRRGALGA